jgi:hypothetical protein
MALARLRFLSCVLAVALLFPPPSLAFSTPLSDTAVWQAFLIGQHHDSVFSSFLESYTKHLPPPKKGPYISSVSFLTPFALVAQFFNQQRYGYTAQQAELDHRRQLETVEIVVVIQLAETYSTVRSNSGVRTTGNAADSLLRPADFWRDSHVQVFNSDPQKPMPQFSYSGQPDLICSDSGCTVIGATIRLESLAESFLSDTATVQVDPPEGDPVTVSFDLTSFR